MAFVQGVTTNVGNASGTSGAFLNNVGAGHGLVCFAIYVGTPGSPTLTDSSGTTWALSKSVSITGGAIAVFETTSAVVAGTHTVTASFTGGGTAWTILLEDSFGQYAGASALGQTLAAPGAGATLKPGGTIGGAGSSVYQLAIDTSHTAAGFAPQTVQLSTNLSTRSDTVGIWTLATDGTVGGKNPGMGPGTSDSTGADTYGVIAMAFLPGGTQVYRGDQIVFSEDPAGYSPTSATYNGLLFNRSTAAPTPAAALLLFVKANPWTLYQTGEWAGVYPVLELSPISARQPQQPAFAGQLFRPSRRLDDIELSPERDDYRRWNHSVYWQYVRLYAAQLVGYTFTLPDFCDDPWLEWVHPKKSDESAIYPYRQINVFIRGQQFNLFWNQPKPWPVEGEPDPVVDRKANYGIMLPWARPAVAVIMPNVVGLPVAVAIQTIENIANLPAPNLTYQNVLYQDPPYAPETALVGLLPAPPPIPAGIVIAQTPAAGAVLQFPFFTSLIVSTGLVTLPGQGASTNYSPVNIVIGDDTPP